MLSDKLKLFSQFITKGLNPCSNGICSLTKDFFIITDVNRTSLNPCSNGICSLTTSSGHGSAVFPLVLILVLMEYAL